jgi:histidinol-phosphatase (PHP family)
MIYETHVHTPLCKHAVGQPEEYAAAAHGRGLAGLIVTCHNPMPDGFAPGVRMEMGEFDEYLRIVERARRRWAGKLDVRLGIECDYFPGCAPFLEEQIRSAPFEYVLGSVHPHLPEYAGAFWRGDVLEFQKTYFRHLAEAAESGLFDCLAHPDLVKNSHPEAWDLDRVFGDVRRALDRIAATGVALELNTSGLNKVLPEFNPGGRMLAAMGRRGIPVVVGSDAHVPDRVGADFPDALDALEAAGYAHASIFLERRRRDIPIAEALATMRRAG